MDEKITVTASALHDLLLALNGPDHYIREIQATRNLNKLMGKTNPIDQLTDEYNNWIESKDPK